MKQITLIRRIAALLALIAGTLLAMALGLTLMNVRADWAFAAGALISIAAPVLGGVQLYAMLKQDEVR